MPPASSTSPWLEGRHFMGLLRDGRQNATIWLTGLPAAGKTTLGAGLVAHLNKIGYPCVHLDGDEVRSALWPDLGFTKADRSLQARRVGYLCEMLNRSGIVAIVSLVSPYREDRDAVRQRLKKFIEVFVDCPVAICAQRDPKQLYRRAFAGELNTFTGVSDVYEAPVAPEVVVHTDREAPHECVQKVLSRIGVNLNV